jgi:hypothetical protein
MVLSRDQRIFMLRLPVYYVLLTVVVTIVTVLLISNPMQTIRGTSSGCVHVIAIVFFNFLFCSSSTRTIFSNQRLSNTRSFVIIMNRVPRGYAACPEVTERTTGEEINKKTTFACFGATIDFGTHGYC